jgi:ABC-type phosphate/phosphonate transport system ATPase subunit
MITLIVQRLQACFKAPDLRIKNEQSCSACTQISPNDRNAAILKMPRKKAEKIAMALLKRVQIHEQAHKMPGRLSGGQQQLIVPVK